MRRKHLKQRREFQKQKVDKKEKSSSSCFDVSMMFAPLMFGDTARSLFVWEALAKLYMSGVVKHTQANDSRIMHSGKSLLSLLTKANDLVAQWNHDFHHHNDTGIRLINDDQLSLCRQKIHDASQVVNAYQTSVEDIDVRTPLFLKAVQNVWKIVHDTLSLYAGNDAAFA